MRLQADLVMTFPLHLPDSFELTDPGSVYGLPFRVKAISLCAEY